MSPLPLILLSCLLVTTSNVCIAFVASSSSVVRNIRGKTVHRGFTTKLHTDHQENEHPCLRKEMNALIKTVTDIKDHYVLEDRKEGSIWKHQYELEYLRRDVTELRGEVKALDGKLEGGLKELEGKLEGGLKELDGKLEGGLKELEGKLEKNLDSMKGELKKLEGELKGELKSVVTESKVETRYIAGGGFTVLIFLVNYIINGK